MALLLAFDISTPHGSVAIGDGDRVFARRELISEGRQAGELVPAIVSILEEIRRTPDELQGIVVGRGPGSFTGVRIAAATARGMATSLDIPLWALSSLAAGALSCGGGVGERPRVLLFDARGDRVYGGCYRISGAGLEVLVQPHASTISEVLDLPLPTGAVFAGDGAIRHREILEADGREVLPAPLGFPTAESLLQLACRPEVHPETVGSRWEPDYLRGSSAIPLSER